MADVTAEEEPGSGVASRSRRRTVISGALLVLMTAFVVIALERNWSQVSSDLASMGFGTLVGSLAIGLAGLTVAALVWLRVIRSMGHDLDGRDGGTIFFSGQLGKYVPGAVWPLVIQAELGRTHHIPRSTMTASYLAAFAASLGAGALVSPLALIGDTPTGVPAVVALGCIGGVTGAVLALHPRGLMRVGGRLLERMGRRLPPIHISTRAAVEAVMGSLLIWCLLGLHAWVIARSLGAGPGDVAPVIGAFALAFVAGLIVVPVPAGAGVREGVLVLVLAGAIGRQSALSVAVASRLVLIVAEIALALIAGVPSSVRWAMARRAQRLQAGGDHERPDLAARPSSDPR